MNKFENQIGHFSTQNNLVQQTKIAGFASFFELR